MDLPSDDPDATFETYADVVAAHLDSGAGDDTILVGHSLAGLTIPLVPQRHAVARLVYLCGLVPSPGSSFVEQLAGGEMLNPAYVEGLSEPDSEGRRRWADPVRAREIMYADCDDADVEAATRRLRPQAPTPYAEARPLRGFPDVPSAYVCCADDHLVRPEWSRWAAKERLDAELVELPGSHSPFLSRPGALASELHALA